VSLSEKNRKEKVFKQLKKETKKKGEKGCMNS